MLRSLTSISRAVPLSVQRPLLMAPALAMSAHGAARVATSPFGSRQYETVLTELRGKVAIVRLNRPKALNALCDAALKDIIDALEHAESDPQVGAIILTGSEKAFAAGADIKEMQPKSFVDHYKSDYFGEMDRVQNIRKPIIAAVNGYALGGGCELAMLCDFIIAGDKAVFGQPEVTIGTICGMGGTQRLIRAIGKSKAMEMVLTGRMMDAREAEAAGLVARVVEAAKLEATALETAEKIASFSPIAISMTKECTNLAYQMNLNEGLRFERRIFQSTFATNDQKEGMKAFSEKRKPKFTNE